jgi:hypothetical protein
MDQTPFVGTPAKPGTLPRSIDTWDGMRAFLEDVFSANSTPDVWTTGFADIEGSPSWHGRAGLSHLTRRFDTPKNLDLYFCIGQMVPGADRRTLGNIASQGILIVDDIGTKVDRAKWDALFALGMPLPTFQIETSPGNETWGWSLSGDGRTPERVLDMALIRAWLPQMGLTDDVMDATRYIRMPGGWNSKPKYRNAVGMSPEVRLTAWRRGEKVDLNDIGVSLLGRADWRDADMPLGGLTSAELRAGTGAAGNLQRVADLNNPEPLIQLAMAVGMNPTGTRSGVVDALCPNIGMHSANADTGFAFLGNGLAQCHHASCQGLRSVDFRAMMEATYDEQQDARRAIGSLAPGEPSTASEFMARAGFEFHGVTFDGADADAVTRDAEKLALTVAGNAVVREEASVGAMLQLSERYVYVGEQNAFFDTVTRSLLTHDQFDRAEAVLAVFPVGQTGLKRAANVFMNDGRLRHAVGLTYKPGVRAAVVLARAASDDEFRPHVNLWKPGSIGRRVGLPLAWFEVVDHVLPDKDAREFWLDVYAFFVQHPGARTSCILTLVGGQGIGKDVIFEPLFTILGSQNVLRAGRLALEGQFNEFLRAQVVVLSELRLTIGAQTYNLIKDWTGATAGRVRLNEKFMKPYSFEPTANFVASTNNWDALAGMEPDDRRFVPYISPAVPAPPAFYQRIGAALKDLPELERIHEFLASRDITHFNPFAPAPNFGDSKRQMLRENMSEVAGWVADQFEAGGLMANRLYFTLTEVEALVQNRAPKNVAVRSSTRSCRSGIDYAGCKPGKRGRAGKERHMVWFGPAMGDKERLAAEALGSGDQVNRALAEAQAIIDAAVGNLGIGDGST